MSDTTPARAEGALAAHTLLVQRLIDRHGLDPVEAHAAVASALRGITDGPHAQLVAAEARAALSETYAAVAARSAEALRSITEAFRALGEAVRRAMTPVRSDYVLAPPVPGTPTPPRARDGRPPWQTPYGPPARRH